MFKVNNKDSRTTHWRRSNVFIGALLLTLNIFHNFFSVSIVNFEQVNAGWVFVIFLVNNQVLFNFLAKPDFLIFQNSEKTLHVIWFGKMLILFASVFSRNVFQLH